MYVLCRSLGYEGPDHDGRNPIKYLVILCEVSSNMLYTAEAGEYYRQTMQFCICVPEIRVAEECDKVYAAEEEEVWNSSEL